MRTVVERWAKEGKDNVCSSKVKKGTVKKIDLIVYDDFFFF